MRLTGTHLVQRCGIVLCEIETAEHQEPLFAINFSRDASGPSTRFSASFTPGLTVDGHPWLSAWRPSLALYFKLKHSDSHSGTH